MSIPTAKQFLGTTPLTQTVREETPNITSAPQAQIFVRPTREQLLVGLFGTKMEEKQYSYILDLTYIGTNVLIFDFEKYDSVIEIINLIGTHLEGKGFGYIQIVLENVKYNPDIDLVWHMPSLEGIKKQSDHEYELSVTKPEGKSYTGKCKRRGCLSVSFHTYSVQKRSIDEPENNYAACNMCGTHFEI